MKDSLRFIHCSDVHLGANPYQIKERFDDMGKVFKDVVDYALKQEDLDFLVIGGDLFHKKNLNAETLDQCIEILKPLNDKNIPVYVTEGNHDKSNIIHNYSWLEFLSKKGIITLLNPVSGDDDTIASDLAEFDKETGIGSYVSSDDYIIYGLGYPGVLSSDHVERLVDGFLPDTEDKVRIAILHTGVDKFCTEDMGGIKYDDALVIADKVDYIALGHIHDEYHNDEGKFYNPGSLETSSLKHKSIPKGFYDVTINKETKERDVKFIEVIGRKILNVNADITNCTDEDEAREEILKTVEDAVNVSRLTKEERAIIRIKVKGETTGGLVVDLNKLKSEIKNEYNLLFCEVVNALTSAAMELDIEDEEISREDYEKIALKNLIELKIASDKDVNKVLKITEEMMRIAKDETGSFDSDDGEKLKKSILDFAKGSLKSKD